MSTDVYWWRYLDGAEHDHVAIVRRLQRSEPLPELAELPAKTIMDEIAAAFAGAHFIRGTLSWTQPGQGTFEIAIEPQCVWLCGYGELAESLAKLNRILEAHGCAAFALATGDRV
jgi:hypothetical protein